MEADFASAQETVSPRRASVSLRWKTQRRRSFGSFGRLGGGLGRDFWRPFDGCLGAVSALKQVGEGFVASDFLMGGLL